jgi:hypothetical protein
MIDVHDCNVRLPSSGDPNDSYVDELVRLSVILGRVLKTIYRFRVYCYRGGVSLKRDSARQVWRSLKTRRCMSFCEIWMLGRKICQKS